MSVVGKADKLATSSTRASSRLLISKADFESNIVPNLSNYNKALWNKQASISVTVSDAQKPSYKNRCMTIEAGEGNIKAFCVVGAGLWFEYAGLHDLREGSEVTISYDTTRYDHLILSTYK